MRRLHLLLLPLILWNGRHAVTDASVPGRNLSVPTVGEDDVEQAASASQSQMPPPPTEHQGERQVGQSGSTSKLERQQKGQLKDESLLPEAPPNNGDSVDVTRSTVPPTTQSNRRTEEDELIRRLLREAQRTKRTRDDGDDMYDDVDGIHKPPAPSIPPEPPETDEKLDYEDDDFPQTCDDLPCGEGQRTCRDAKGLFICTCMPGYWLHRIRGSQPLCIKLDDTESTGRPDNVVDEAPDNKWVVGWSVLGVVLGVLLLVVIMWGAVMIYQRVKSTSSRDVQDEFRGLLADKKPSVDTIDSYKKTPSARQNDEVRENFRISQEQLDSAML